MLRRLSKNLHSVIENIALDDLPKIVTDLKRFGGYFKRFRMPASFKDIAELSTGKPLPSSRQPTLTLEQRINMSYLKADIVCTQEQQPPKNQAQKGKPV